MQTNSRHGCQIMSELWSTFATAFTVAILFTSGNTYAGDKSATADDQALRKLEREWVDAETRHDAVALQSILEDKFVATFGALNQDDRLARLNKPTSRVPRSCTATKSAAAALLSY